MQGFSFSTCAIHKDSQITHICFESKAKYICQLCVSSNDCCSSHPKYVMKIADFASNIEETSASAELLVQKSMARHAELTELAGKVKNQYIKEEDQNIKYIMKILQQESQRYKQLCKKVASQKQKFTSTLKLIKYFLPFHDPQLFDIKMNLSSPKGLRVFFNKSINHSALLNKRVQNDLKKLENELLAEQKKISQFEFDSLTFKIKTLQSFLSKPEVKPLSQMKVINIPMKEQK